MSKLILVPTAISLQEDTGLFKWEIEPLQLVEAGDS